MNVNLHELRSRLAIIPQVVFPAGACAVPRLTLACVSRTRRCSAAPYDQRCCRHGGFVTRVAAGMQVRANLDPIATRTDDELWNALNLVRLVDVCRRGRGCERARVAGRLACPRDWSTRRTRRSFGRGG